MSHVNFPNTFSTVLDAVAGVLDGAMPPATRKVLFGLLFISLAEEEGTEIVALAQPLLALIPAAGCSVDGIVTCLPGEATGKHK